MIILLKVFQIVLLFSLFGLLHSYLASIKIKKKLVNRIGDLISFYRLFYNFISIITFYFIYRISPKPDIIIYDLDYPLDILIFGLQAVSVIGILWSGLPSDLQEFLGISQILRWYKYTYNKEDLDEIPILITDGPYKISRHPVYFFTILFLGFRPTMSLFYFVFFICIIVYFYVGSYYEERKLLEKFGEIYADYMKNVPRIFPSFFRKKLNLN
jgi:hypothetical protein